MEYRITSGTAALELAASIAATSGEFNNFKVEGAFLVYNLPRDIEEAKAAVNVIGIAISALRDEANEAGEAYEAHSTLINTTMSLLHDIDRDFVPSVSDTNQESQSTTANDAAIDNVSSQLNTETNNQEQVNEAQFESKSSRNASRAERK